MKKPTTYHEESRFISKEKIKEARESLADAIAFVNFNENNFYILLKAKAFLSECLISDSGYNFVIGVSSSLNDVKEFSSELTGLSHYMARKYSPRDINIDLIEESIIGYLREQLYDSPETEKAPAIEFILIEANFSQVKVRVINFDASICCLLPDEKFVLVGCTDETKREQLENRFQEIKLYELSCGAALKKFGEETKEFHGVLHKFQLVTKTNLHEARSKKKPKTKPKRTQSKKSC